MKLHEETDSDDKICNFCPAGKQRYNDPTWKVYTLNNNFNITRFCEKCLKEFILRATALLGE